MGQVKASYNYALAVDSQKRGLGYSREILEYLDRYQQKLGFAAATLKPANRQLFDYYEKFGYNMRFPVRLTQLEEDEIEPTTTAASSSR